MDVFHAFAPPHHGAARTDLAIPASGTLKLLTQLQASGLNHVLYAELGAASGSGSARSLVNLAWRTQECIPGSRGNGVERGFIRLYRLLHLRGRFTLTDIAAAFG